MAFIPLFITCKNVWNCFPDETTTWTEILSPESGLGDTSDITKG